MADFPARPVRYVVPFGPGGPPDLVARAVADELSRRWAHPVAVDNRPGANGNVGSEFVAKSPPDGHTLLQGTSATHSSNPVLFPMLPFDPQKDLAPVIPLIEGPLYLACSRAMNFASLEEFFAAARAKPGVLRFATAGPGSPQHLAGELLRAMAGVDIVPVHYAGAKQALAAILQDEIELYFSSEFMAHEQAAKLPLLAVSTRWRWPRAGHVPTLIERGIADFEIHGWFGVFCPSGTPAPVVERINRDIDAALLSPGMAQALDSFGYRVLGGGTRDFAERLRREALYWRELVGTHKLSLV